jgi:hypothetical protein
MLWAWFTPQNCFLGKERKMFVRIVFRSSHRDAFVGRQQAEIANQRSIGTPCTLGSEHKASVPDANTWLFAFYPQKRPDGTQKLWQADAA